MALTKVTKSGLGTDSVGSEALEDGVISSSDISPNSVTGSNLSQSLDLSGKTITLPNNSVTSAQLVGSIPNAKLTNSSFTVNGTSVSLGSSITAQSVDWQSVITADGSTSTTAVAGNGYFIDTTSNAHTINLPGSASLGDLVAIKDYAGTFNTNNLTIGRNGHNIQGQANDSLLSTNRASVVLVYVDSTKGWLYVEEQNVADLTQAPAAGNFISATGGTVTESGDYKIHSFTGDGCFVVSCAGDGTPTAPSVVDYLVVAGGAGGSFGDDFSGGGGGGGAGGYRESSGNSGCYTASPLATPTGITVTATTYPVTVGAGGVGPSAANCRGTNGSNSVFSTITSTGGGTGGLSNPLTPALPGGSGGGAARTNLCGTFGSGNTPPVSPPQGNNGGLGYGAGGSLDGGGGGGGGAGGVGGNSSCSPVACTPIVGGAGGTGVATAITGSPLFYAGGGGGGSTGGAVASSGGSSVGGDGGGCTASPTNSPGKDATANRGGGGGGGAARAPGANPLSCSGRGGTGGAGGKGIVVIRYKYQ